MLEIERLAVSYGEVVALRDVSLTVNNAEIVTLMSDSASGSLNRFTVSSAWITTSASVSVVIRR